MATDFRQLKAIEKKNKERILKLDPSVPELPGIYAFYRLEEGIKYAYVGQAKHLLTRLAQHLSGYQHIDLSIKKHGLWSTESPTGWNFGYRVFENADLDELEKEYIKKYADMGYQLRNKTVGGQGKGKTGLDDKKPSKGYYDGKRQGYINAQRFVANLFDKHLTYRQKSDKPNKIQEKAMAKFKEFLNLEEK